MSKLYRLISLFVLSALFFGQAMTASAQGPTGTWASGIACVNLDSGNAANITLTFYAQMSSTVALSYNDAIPAGGSKNYFTPSSPPGLPSGFLGSLVVSSSTQIYCNVNSQTTGTGTTTDPYRIGTSSGFSAGAPVIYAPQVEKAFFGWNSYIAVQNTESGTINVTVSYKDANGNAISAATETASIPGNSNKVFYQASNSNLPSGFLGSATIASQDGTSKIVAAAAFYNAGTSNTDAQFHSYNAFTSGAATVFVPRVVRRFFGYNSGLSIQNVGGASISGSITITFNFSGNTYVVTRSTPLAAGASWVLYLPNVAELNGVDSLLINQRFGSARIEAPGGSTIVAIVNEDNRGNPADNNGAAVPPERIGQGSTYNAVNATGPGSPTNTAFFPQVPKNAGGVFSGGFQVSNTTGTATTCNITYGSSGVTELNVPLAANGSLSRYGPSVAALPNGYNSSVTVTCGQPIVGISNLAVNIGSGRYGDSFTQGNGLNQ